MKNSAVDYFSENVLMEFYEAKREDNKKREIIDFQIGKNVHFIETEWNFNYLNTNNRARNTYRFDFNSIPQPFIYYSKILILNELIVLKNSIGTAKRVYRVIKTVTRFFYTRGISDVKLISFKIISDYFKTLEVKCSALYLEGVSVCIRKFLKIVEEIDNINSDIIINYLSNKQTEFAKQRPYTAINNYIPDAFLNQIVSLSLKDLDNCKLSLDDRIFAGLLVILSETGMRAEELSLIEAGKLDSIKIGDKEANYLTFLTFKTQRYKSEGKETYCYMSNISTKAYRTCEKLADKIINNLSNISFKKLTYYLHTGISPVGRNLSSEQEKVLDNLTLEDKKRLHQKARRYLFICSKRGFLKRGDSPLIERLQKFFIRHYDDIDLSAVTSNEKNLIDYFSITSEAKYNKLFSSKERNHLSYENIKNIKFPYVNLHRFRTTVCTKLFLRGVHIDFIIKHMNHISEDMTAYYNKSHIFINELEESIKILASIANNDGLLEAKESNINDEFMKKELSNKDVKENIEKVNKFLENNKLNIRTDINKIIKLLEKSNTSIAENEFGMCIRSLISGFCERKKYFSSLTDKYFIGIQLETYKFIHFNYERFTQKLDVVNHNRKIAEKDSRYSLEFQREEKALKGFVTKTLLKELTLLVKDISSFGEKYVINNYPELKDIVERIDYIKEEIMEWIIQ